MLYYCSNTKVYMNSNREAETQGHLSININLILLKT